MLSASYLDRQKTPFRHWSNVTGCYCDTELCYCTWDKPTNTQSLLADTRGCGCWFFLLPTVWPHIGSVPICGICDSIHAQSPTPTVKIIELSLTVCGMWLGDGYPWSQSIHLLFTMNTCKSWTVNPYNFLQVRGCHIWSHSCYINTFCTFHSIGVRRR